MKVTIEIDDSSFVTLSMKSKLEPHEEAYILCAEAKRLVRFLTGQDWGEDPDLDEPKVGSS